MTFRFDNDDTHQLVAQIISDEYQYGGQSLLYTASAILEALTDTSDVDDKLKARIMELESALLEIRYMKVQPKRHFSGPSPEDELDATVDYAEFENLQEIAYCAIFPKKENQ